MWHKTCYYWNNYSVASISFSLFCLFFFVFEDMFRELILLPNGWLLKCSGHLFARIKELYLGILRY